MGNINKAIKQEQPLSCDYQQLPHRGIQTLQPYVPGKSIDALARESGITDIIKLASNENPYGCSPLAQAALAGMSKEQIAAYPNPGIHPLKAKLSAHLQMDEHCLTFSNGSDLLFSLLLTLFGLHRKKFMLTHDKAFSTYTIQAKALGIPIKSSPLLSNWEVDIDAMIDYCTPETALIFLANPNNPTGLLIPEEKILTLLNHVPKQTIVVIDEAYYEYAYSPSSTGSLAFLEQFPNLVIARTFSKIYGLAGLRLGYAIAHPSIIELLNRVQPPFSVNTAALTAAYHAMDDQDFLKHTKKMNNEGMVQMQRGLNELRLDMMPSACNFITFDCKTNSLPIYQALLSHGIIVRPLNAYDLPNHLRVSIGKPEQNTRFLSQLGKIINQEGEYGE